MSLIESPDSAIVVAQVDPTFQSLRVSARPVEYKSRDGSLVGGYYRTKFSTGNTTVLNALDAILSMRWTSDNLLFMLDSIRIWATIITAFTTAQETSLDLVKMNGFTNADSGGTDLVPSLAAGSGRMRSTMQPSRIADLRVANATALGAGTGTADGAALGFATFPIVNVVGSTGAEDLLETGLNRAEHPLLLTKNEGFRVRIGVTQGAVGVVRFSGILHWAEIPTY